MTLERCHCDTMAEAVNDGLVTVRTWERQVEKKGFRPQRVTAQIYSLVKVSEPDPDDAYHEGRVIRFCPFCGLPAGDYQKVADLLEQRN